MFDVILILEKSSLRRVLHCTRKCNSVSMVFGQKGQNLLAFSTLKCLPFFNHQVAIRKSKFSKCDSILCIYLRMCSQVSLRTYFGFD